MENITVNYLHRAEIWLCLATVIYFFINGAQIFETLVLVPKWTASPPKSLKILSDGHGMSLKTFWILFHSIHEIVFIMAIIFCWKIDPVRNWLILLFVIHLLVRIWTLSYFAPNIIDFQRMADQQFVTEAVAARISRWQLLNYIRVAVFIAVSIGFIPLCIKLFSIRI
ncbi:transposase [Chryseobacterium contaminans]|uniref:transposase n=1 Tax=Chryseobacterium contaminans TaxID=1423959 RepID=UPI003016851B